MKIGIVGGGLTGCIIGSYLRNKGYQVDIYDNYDVRGASKAALGLVAPQWVSRIDNVDIGLEVLESLGEEYNEEYHFEIRNPVKNFIQKIKRFNVQKLIQDSCVINRIVTHVYNDKIGITDLAQYVFYDKIIVCAGIWSDKLLTKCPKLFGKVGTTLFYDSSMAGNKIIAYAPFKQAITFKDKQNRRWFADGTAILDGNYDPHHIKRTVERAAKYTDFQVGGYDHYLTGIRPFIKCNPNGICEKVSNTLWVATGGGKNGTILAAIWADKIARNL
jgi:glycine/D-amino acid oxidase-like deaminating enzyme